MYTSGAGGIYALQKIDKGTAMLEGLDNQKSHAESN